MQELFAKKLNNTNFCALQLSHTGVTLFSSSSSFIQFLSRKTSRETKDLTSQNDTSNASFKGSKNTHGRLLFSIYAHDLLVQLEQFSTLLFLFKVLPDESRNTCKTGADAEIAGEERFTGAYWALLIRLKCEAVKLLANKTLFVEIENILSKKLWKIERFFDSFTKLIN